MIKTYWPGGRAIPSGTAASPGLAFAVDADTGIYRVSANVLGFTAAGLLAASLGHQTVLAANDGTVLSLGRPNQTFASNPGAEAYAATINAVNISTGNNTQGIGLNINRWTLTHNDTVQQTHPSYCGELDLMDVVAGAGAISNTVGYGGWRTRVPQLGAGVTAAAIWGMGFTPPNAFSGTVAVGYILNMPNVVAPAHQPTNGWRGIHFGSGYTNHIEVETGNNLTLNVALGQAHAWKANDVQIGSLEAGGLTVAMASGNVNGVLLQATTTGNAPTIAPSGPASDAAIALIVATKGNAPLYFNAFGSTRMDYGGAVGGQWTATTPIQATSFKTGNPSGGTAQHWKLGSISATASAFDATRYVEAEINGVACKLALVT